MTLRFITDKVSYRFEVLLITISVLFYIFRPTIPAFKYPFLLTFICIFLLSVVKYKLHLISTIAEFVKFCFTPLLLAFILALAFIFSGKIYLIVFKDLVNTIIILSLLLIMNLIIKSKNDLYIFIKILFNLIVIFAFVISINGLGHLFEIFDRAPVMATEKVRYLMNPDYLELDKNFGILPVIFGTICILHLSSKPETPSRRLIFDLLIPLFSIAIILSGSRRAVFILMALLVISVVVQIFKLGEKEIKFRLVDFRYIFFILISVVIFWMFFSLTSYGFKNKALELIGSGNIVTAKENVASMLFRYYSSFDRGKTYLDFYNRIWDVVPYDPDSGWGTRNHKTVFPLAGNNVNIVPENARGYLLDSSCIATTSGGNAYSFTMIGDKKVNEGENICASVYCYVSKEFNGDWVRLSSEGSTYGKVEDYYDLGFKGIWQRLELNANCSKGNTPVFLYFCRNGAEDFSTLSGYVIFAYPVVDLCTESDSIVINTTTESNFIGHKKVIPHTRLINNPLQASFASLIALSMNNIDLNHDRDPIRKWFGNLISEDTTYISYESDIMVEDKNASFSDTRLARWKFAWQIFTKEYNTKKKLVGGGFDHLNWFGYYFLKDKTASDWPHNPFLSVLLYSGLAGLLIYLFFMFRVFYYYVKYFKWYPLLFVFFLITFFFSFFSGSSPFDPPVMGFFALLPFFINSVMKNDKSLLNKTNE